MEIRLNEPTANNNPEVRLGLSKRLIWKLNYDETWVLHKIYTFFYGLAYQNLMKLSHKYHWHHMPPVYPNGDTLLYCEWCGLRKIVQKG